MVIGAASSGSRKSSLFPSFNAVSNNGKGRSTRLYASLANQEPSNNENQNLIGGSNQNIDKTIQQDVMKNQMNSMP